MKELEDALDLWRRREEALRFWESTYHNSTKDVGGLYRRLLDERSLAMDAFRKAVLAAQRPQE